MTQPSARVILVASLLAAAACGRPRTHPPTADGGAQADGGVPADGGLLRDGGPAQDGGTVADGGSPADGGLASDAGPPADAGQTACREDRDCTSGQRCFAPGEPPCTACRTPSSTCSTDEDCTQLGESFICHTFPEECYCVDQGGVRSFLTTCGPACVEDAQCAEGMECDSFEARCLPALCEGDTECPAHFSCRSDGTDMVCQRKVCASDTDCPAGACLKRACYATPGRCG